MSPPTGPQDPRIPHQHGAVPQAGQAPTQPAQKAKPGYGYPPTQYPQPVQQGYPYEIRPGLPQQPQPYVPNPNEPDWSALADQHVAERKRKRLAVTAGPAGAL